MSSEKDFENLVAEAIRVRLTELIGPRAAETMNSYLEPSLAARNPKDYDTRLRAICGKAADVILRKIEIEICERIGMEKRVWSSLGHCLAAARTQVAVIVN